jgi:hypothetical protein
VREGWGGVRGGFMMLILTVGRSGLCDGWSIGISRFVASFLWGSLVI